MALLDDALGLDPSLINNPQAMGLLGLAVSPNVGDFDSRFHAVPDNQTIPGTADGSAESARRAAANQAVKDVPLPQPRPNTAPGIPLPRPDPRTAMFADRFDALPPPTPPMQASFSDRFDAGVGAPMNIAPDPNQFLPQTSMSTAQGPQAAPQAASQPAVPPTSFLGRLGNGLAQNSNTLLALGAGMAGAPSLGIGLGRGFAAALPAAQMDLKLKQQNQTVQALVNRGLPLDVAQSAATNPAILQQILPQVLGAKQMQFTQIGEDMSGNKKYGFVNPSTGEVRPYEGSSPFSSGVAQMPINFDPTTGRDEDFLAALKKSDPVGYETVQKILSGDVSAQGRNMQKYLPVAARAEQGFSQQSYNTRLKTMQDFAPQGVSGKNITAINTALGHINQMHDAAEKLGNLSYAPALNAPYNLVRGQVSPDYQTKVAHFNSLAIGSSGELAKAFRSAGMSERDIQEWQNQFSKNSSPETIKSAAETALHMLDSRLDSIADSYNRGMGIRGETKNGADMMSPKARKIHDRLLGVNQNTQQPSAAPAQGAPQAGDPLTEARDALAQGADRNQVIMRLQQHGINPSGL